MAALLRLIRPSRARVQAAQRAPEGGRLPAGLAFGIPGGFAAFAPLAGLPAFRVLAGFAALAVRARGAERLEPDRGVEPRPRE